MKKPSLKVITQRAPWLAKVLSSIWLFPLVITLILLALTALKISGSSMGVYYNIFDGHAHHDSDLLFSKPKDIRADEWLVNTQMTVAQDQNDYAVVNDHIGKGQDMSVVLDVPYAEWSQAFRPQNLIFFVLPLEYAFAFKWWLLAYLLVLSCYFFVLALLPGRRLVAAGISISLLFGGMVQWWYQTITLAPLYYSLFIATAAIHALRAKRLRHTALWSALIGYLAACFALVLYPPFQIACTIGLAAFLLGFGVQYFRSLSKAQYVRFYTKIGILAAGCAAGGAAALLFVKTRSDVISTITHTAYPGERVIQSGGFDAIHIFTGNLGFLLASLTRAEHYQILHGAFLNQSEASNFMLLLPFLLVPSAYLITRDIKHKQRLDWPLITVNVTFLFMIAWMLLPGLDFLGKLLLLDKVQHVRVLIGLGLLNVLQLVLFIRRLDDFKGRHYTHLTVIGYSLLVLGVQLWLGLFTMHRSPGFIQWYEVIALSLPLPLVTYLLLRKQITLAIIGFAAFSFLSTAIVNPLYHGTKLVTDTQLIRTIQHIDHETPGTWATETIFLENFPAASGVRSVTGVYAYPQLGLWRGIEPKQEDIYNRYAHVNIAFDRNPDLDVPTSLKLPSPDHFDIISEPCSAYVQKDIGYILTTSELTGPCLTLKQMVKYPVLNIYIYKVR